MTPFYVREHRVTWGECDPAGIVFAPRFLDMFSENSIRLFEHAGLPKKKQMLAELHVTGFPMVDVRAKFLRPVSYGDDVLVESAAPAFRSSSFTIEHRLTLDGETCVECTETRVWTIPAPDMPGGLKAARVPDAIRMLFVR